LQGAHKQLQAVQAAAPDEALAAAAAGAAAAIQRQVTPDFSRKQLKSLRRLFPMQAPAVKSAVTLQVRAIWHALASSINVSCASRQSVCIKAVCHF
jgi:hypothetical protein